MLILHYKCKNYNNWPEFQIVYYMIRIFLACTKKHHCYLMLTWCDRQDSTFPLIDSVVWYEERYRFAVQRLSSRRKYQRFCFELHSCGHG